MASKIVIAYVVAGMAVVWQIVASITEAAQPLFAAIAMIAK